MLKDSVLTSQKEHCKPIKKTDMLSRETITLYCKNHTQHIINCEENSELFNAKVRGIYNYHCTLKGDHKKVYNCVNEKIGSSSNCCVFYSGSVKFKSRLE
jgi:hypothetical protein